MTAQAPAVRAIGLHAQRALLRSGGRIETLAQFSDSRYARAGDEIVCVAHGDPVMHPRVVVLSRPLEATEHVVPGVAHLRPWQPPPWRACDDPECVRERAAKLRRAIVSRTPPRGFGVMLAGGAPDFPLDRATAHVEKLARACLIDDADAAYEAALPLIGLGPGLTPSGDDLVGAAFLARRAMARSPEEATRWTRAADRLREASGELTHPIAAALLRDLLDGASFAPLHRVAAALACGEDAQDEAARALIRIGHSSGWDMLTGLLVGMTGEIKSAPQATPHPPRSRSAPSPRARGEGWGEGRREPQAWAYTSEQVIQRRFQ